jgi:hypothetical protein
VTLFLFEFMDHPWTPHVLRETLLDVLEYCNRDFRPYYREIADEISRIARERELTTVVEFGAGYAPLTRELAAMDGNELTLIPCDLYPEPSPWDQLREEFGSCIRPVYEPVDATIRHDWPQRTAVVLCATLHHIPPGIRRTALEALHDSSDCVLVFEPVRKTPFSMFLVLFALIPALLTPAFRMTRPGRLRRVLFCWLLPIVPLMFVWDGLISCLRQWSNEEWANFTSSLPDRYRRPTVNSTPHSQSVIW